MARLTELVFFMAFAAGAHAASFPSHQVSTALAEDDSCTRDDASCGLGALQAAAKAVAKEKSTAVSKSFSLELSSVTRQPSSQQRNQRGLDIVKKLRETAHHVLQEKNADPSLMLLDVGVGFDDESLLVTARASLAAPIIGGSILVLAILALHHFMKMFDEKKQETETLWRERTTPPDDIVESQSIASTGTPGAPGQEHESALEDRPEDAFSTTQGGSAVDETASVHSVRSSDESSAGALCEKNDPDTKAPFLALFRFATRRDMLLTVMGTLFGAVHGACMPMAFFFMGELYEAIYLPNDDGSFPPVESPHTLRDAEVQKVGLTYVLLAFVVLVARTGACLMVIEAADRQVVIARMEYFKKILRQGPAWHDKQDTQSLAPQLVNDTHLFRDGIGERLVDFSRACAMAVSATLLACQKDWKLTIVMSVVMPISALCISMSIEIMRHFSTVLESCYAKAGQIALVAAESIKTVTAFNGQKRELKAFNGHVEKAKGTAIQIGVVGGFSLGLVNTTTIAGLSLGVYFGSLWILQDYENDCWRSNPPYGNCRSGGSTIAAMYTIIWGFTMGIGTMGMCLTAFANGRAAVHRISCIIDDDMVIKSGDIIPARVEGEVKFEDVYFSYPKRRETLALKGVTIHITAGSTTAFVGSSGSGKSTLINLLLRFYEPQSGTVCLDGHDLRTLNLTWLRSKLALVEQEPLLFQGDIFENIACGSVGTATTRFDVEHAAKLSNAHCFIESFPQGYETKVGEAGSQLSGGQKQRLAISRALIRNPAVLLLDEATSALDATSERAVQEALDELLRLRGRTTIVVAHRLSTIRGADQICVLDTGRVVETGSHQDLLAAEGAYKNLLQLQFAVPQKETQPSGIQVEVSKVQEPAAAPAVAAPAEVPYFQSGAAQNLLEARKLSQTVKLREAEASTDETESVMVKELKAYKFEEDFGTRYAVAQVWKLTREDYKYYIIGMAFSIVGAAIMPYFSLQFAHTINIFNQPPAVKDPETGKWHASYNEPSLASAVTNLCLSMQALCILQILQAIGAAWAFTKAGELLAAKIRNLLFEAVLRQEMAWHDKHGTAQLLWKLGADIPQMKALAGANMASGVNALFTMVIGMTIALWLNWKFTLLCMCISPMQAIGGLAVMLNWRKIDGDFSSGIVAEAINGVKAVTAFGLEARLVAKYEILLMKHMADERRTRQFSALGTGVSSAGMFMISAAVVFGINWFASRGLMQLDQATIIFMVLLNIMGAAGELTRLFADTALPQDAARRLFNVIKRCSKIDPYSSTGLKLDKVEGRVEFQDVFFRYPNRPNMPVFEGLSFTVEAGTTTALVGSSGGGKSTAVALLQRFYDPQAGVILLDGHNLTDLNISWLRTQMSLVQQEPVLFARSILQNIKYGFEDVPMVEVEKAAKAANATEFLEALPQGYSTEAGHRGAQLSGGQKQRVAIARALLRDPALLLLDEATSSLDAVQDALDALLKTRPRTTIIIAHRLSTVREANQICVFSGGCVVERGRHDQLVAKGGTYAQLVAAQQICV
eukprot:TRINITY_DN29758_c0_g1_i2.p1 TRINITY_DN29758_c0_g1~~TRINITY_DN29758_c0_g1_i2.p1  ORF type:complete len:1525 (+),score=304.23 TRINITY_DN29758_c0_g1_i2:99-4673(+)